MRASVTLQKQNPGLSAKINCGLRPPSAFKTNMKPFVLHDFFVRDYSVNFPSPSSPLSYLQSRLSPDKPGRLRGYVTVLCVWVCKCVRARMCAF